MNSFSHRRLNLFSISTVFVLIINALTTNAQTSSSIISDLFKDDKAAFHSAFLLTALSNEKRKLVCDEFQPNQNLTSGTLIYLLDLHPFSDARSPSWSSRIPTFICMNSTSVQFHVTVSTQKTEFPFFALIETGDYERQDIIKMVGDVLGSKAIPSLHSELDEVQDRILEFFQTDDYQEIARKSFQERIDNNEWPTLCEKFYTGYKRERATELAETMIMDLEVTLDETKEPVEIPLLTCDLADDIFFVAWLNSNIIFEVSGRPDYDKLRPNYTNLASFSDLIFGTGVDVDKRYQSVLPPVETKQALESIFECNTVPTFPLHYLSHRPSFPPSSL